MKARVYCSRNQKEESSPLLRLDIFNPLVVNSDRSDAKRMHKKSWTCTFMACLSTRLSGSLTHSLACFLFFGPAGIQLHHSSENGSSDYRKGKHEPRGFVYERSAVRSPYITNQDAPPNQPPHPQGTLLSMDVVAFGIGVGEACVQISSFNSTHRSTAVCVADMLVGVFVPPHGAVR